MSSSQAWVANLHSQAEHELVEAARFYNRQVSGLGDEFITEVERTVARLALDPQTGSPVRPRIRRGLVDRFPFSVVYLDGRVPIYVVAVMHHRRRPGYWQHRVGQ